MTYFEYMRKYLYICRRISNIKVFINMEKKNNKNRVIVENGQVRTIIDSEYLTLEESCRLLHEIIDKEYDLP